MYLAKQGGRNQAVGLIPAASGPLTNASASRAADANVVTRPDRYRSVEQLLEDKLIREVRTPGEISAAAAG
jgi:hypothetical protein